MRAKKIDVNQPLIVNQLRRCGFSVAVTSQLGQGFPDIVVGKYGKNLLVELKDPDKPASARKLTPDEQKFHEAWQGNIIIALTVEDILNEFNKINK